MKQTKKYYQYPPSMISGHFCTMEQYLKWEKAVNKRQGIKLRTLFIGDYSISLNKNFNENLNFLKQNISPILNQFLSLIPFKNYLSKILFKKKKMYSYHNLDWSNPPFKLSEGYNFGYLGFSPFFLDTKVTGSFRLDKRDLNKIENLKNFKSYNYKPIMPFRVGLKSHKWKKTNRNLKKIRGHYEI